MRPFTRSILFFLFVLAFSAVFFGTACPVEFRLHQRCGYRSIGSGDSGSIGFHPKSR